LSKRTLLAFAALFAALGLSRCGGSGGGSGGSASCCRKLSRSSLVEKNAFGVRSSLRGSLPFRVRRQRRRQRGFRFAAPACADSFACGGPAVCRERRILDIHLVLGTADPRYSLGPRPTRPLAPLRVPGRATSCRIPAAARLSARSPRVRTTLLPVAAREGAQARR
jgi:hypothetical protein